MERERKSQRTNFANILWKNRTLSGDSRKRETVCFVRLTVHAKTCLETPERGLELPLVENGRAKGFKIERL
jgi:hypothetical protein